jgi:hypothetical protein
VICCRALFCIRENSQLETRPHIVIGEQNVLCALLDGQEFSSNASECVQQVILYMVNDLRSSCLRCKICERMQRFSSKYVIHEEGNNCSYADTLTNA